MKLQKSFQLALNILLHSKLRSWLTIIGIVIGVGAIVSIVSIGQGAQANVNARLGGLGADIITVSPGFSRAAGGFGGGEGRTQVTTKASKNITIKDIELIKSVPGVLYASGSISGKASMTYLAETASVSIDGVDTETWKNVATSVVDSGRLIDPGDTDVIVIGNGIATTTFSRQLSVNNVVTISGKAFKIVGILQASGGFGGGDRNVYMPLQPARDMLNKTDSYDEITIKASSADIALQVANDTDAKLMLFRHVTTKTKDYSVTSAQAIQQSIQGVTQTFTTFLAAIAGVSLLVGAVGIANTMFTSVLEKTKEIGVMKAIGAKNIDIMMIFLFNSGLVGFVGGLIGIMLGSVVSYVLPNFLSGFGGGIGGRGGLTTVLSPTLLIEAIVISVGVGMIAGVIPAYRASKLKPVDALRYE